MAYLTFCKIKYKPVENTIEQYSRIYKMTDKSSKVQASKTKRLTNIEMSIAQKFLDDRSPQPQIQPQPQPKPQPKPQPVKAEKNIKNDLLYMFKIVRQPTDRLFTTILWISIGSMIGVTIRILLTEAGQAFYYQITPLLKFLGFSYFWANCVGCFVMGVFTTLKTAFQPHHKYIIIGITTGFCGSCTTLSSWMVALNALFFIGYNWMNTLQLIVIQFVVFLCAFYLGFHLARIINMNKIPAIREIPWWVGLIFYILCVAGACIGAGLNEVNRGKFIAALFGPFGAVARYLLGLYNNPRLPIGTFTANVIASFLLTLLFLGNYSESFNQWYYVFGMWGVGEGIMGSLSTVSTWVNQIRTLGEDRLKAGYCYTITTVLFIQFMIAIIFGIWVGTHHEVFW